MPFKRKDPDHSIFSQKGGVALEYVLVTTFAAIVSIAALGFVGTMMKEKITSVAEKMGVEVQELNLNPFKD